MTTPGRTQGRGTSSGGDQRRSVRPTEAVDPGVDGRTKATGGDTMSIASRGFPGREAVPAHKLPHGQYETQGFPVLSEEPSPRIPLEQWQFTVTTEQGNTH